MSELLDESGIEAVLGRETVARLGCHADGYTYVVPVAYAYYAGACYGHMSDGLKLRMLRANPAVCVEVETIQDLARWETVIAQGRFEELTGADARHGAELFMARVSRALTGSVPRGDAVARLATRALERGIMYRIQLVEKTGRSERGGVAEGWLGEHPDDAGSPEC